MRCSNCQTENPSGAKFCMNCGNLIKDVSQTDETRLGELASAAPAVLAEKMRAAAHLAGERRIVTAVFADVVGSTALAEGLDPEEWTGIMNRAFDQISKPIYYYEGTIARLMGDSILAFFGAPVAHEDDPARAVKAGLDILEAVQKYAEDLKKNHDIDFKMRVGINTGPVVVGEVGSDLKFEYTAMGDAINLAARLQSAAKPMTVLISEETRRYIAPLFELEDLGQIEVKGKAGSVHVYEVIKAKDKAGKVRGLKSAGLESPMVGRDRELEQLTSLTKALRESKGQMAVVVGEAGLGKSRLIMEWKAASKGKGKSAFQWATGQCLSYGQGLAYHLLIDLLRGLVGVPAAAEEAETHEALKKLTDELFEAASDEVYPFLGHLLSLKLDSQEQARIQQLDPQALQAQYLMALRRLLQAKAEQRPLILILEDIHWADPSSTDILIKLMPLTREARLLFCLLSRPEQDAPGWKLVKSAKENYGDILQEVHLSALTETDSRQLVANLLEIEAIPEKTRTLILQKAEGNPFFVEEVIRMLIDRGALTQKNGRWVAEKEIENIDIPDNLQGLLLARIDRLPDEVKHTLRVASVIGRQFAVRVLEEVLQKEE